MKRTYILLTRTICTIGGAQVYVRNKVKYLRECGWNVEVFSYTRDEIMINDLRPFEKNINTMIKYPPKCFPEKQIHKIVEEIVNSSTIDKCERVVVESHEITLSLWGEMLARSFECKHITYLLSEDFPTLPQGILKYLDFKHKRKELAGIHKQSLKLLFKNYKLVSDNEGYSLRAVCENSVEDVPNSIVDNIVRKDINIGCISRLQKSFVNTMVNEIICFSRNNSGKTIQLILIGASPGNIIEEKIIYKTKGIKNLNVVIVGRVFPIPKKVFKLIDLFISVAGSAGASANEGVLTLTLDVRSHKPIGFLGYDTQESLYSQSDYDISITDVLERILIKKQGVGKNRYTNYKSRDYNKEYLKHLAFIDASDKNNNYYEIESIKLTPKDLLKKYLIGILGVSLFEIIMNHIYKFRLRNLK